jgi:hypothetical protein
MLGMQCCNVLWLLFCLQGQLKLDDLMPLQSHGPWMRVQDAVCVKVYVKTSNH